MLRTIDLTPNFITLDKVQENLYKNRKPDKKKHKSFILTNARQTLAMQMLRNLSMSILKPKSLKVLGCSWNVLLQYPHSPTSALQDHLHEKQTTYN